MSRRTALRPFRGLGLRFPQDRNDVGLDKGRQQLGRQLGAGRDLAQPLAGVYRQSGAPPRRDARQLRQAYRSPSRRLSVQCSFPAMFFCL